MPDSTISNLTAQTTLHDADLGVGVDTTDTTQSANGTTKKFTWTTIKSFLKTYFDGIYVTGGSLPVKATGAEINTGTDDAKFATAKAIADSVLKQYPEGAMLNGKIVPSVASNNLTVALKTKAGTDPSTTDPVFVMIGGTLRTITSALSHTMNAGVNCFNAGSAELATKEIDYFVYIFFNTTDGATEIGTSRIPYGTLYSDFVPAVFTNEKCIRTNVTGNPTATDAFVNIGRFAATLSAGAGYTWTVPTFTASNLVQRPIFETRWLTYLPAFGTGFNTITNTRSVYKIRGNQIFWESNTSGTTTAVASFTKTIPLGRPNADAYTIAGTGRIYDGSLKWCSPSWNNTSQSQLLLEFQSAFSAASGRDLRLNGFYEI